MQWQIFHANSGRKQYQQLSRFTQKEGELKQTTGQRLLTATGNWEGRLGKENLAFFSGISLHFRNLQRESFTCMECGILNTCHPLLSGSPPKRGRYLWVQHSFN